MKNDDSYFITHNEVEEEVRRLKFKRRKYWFEVVRTVAAVYVIFIQTIVALHLLGIHLIG